MGEGRDPYAVPIMRKAAAVALLCERTTKQQRQRLWIPAFVGTTERVTA